MDYAALKSPGPLPCQRLEVHNLAAMAEWVDGSIKGVRLPPADRIIHFHREGQEQEIKVGQWVVMFAPKWFVVYDDADFDLLFSIVPRVRHPLRHMAIGRDSI